MASKNILSYASDAIRSEIIRFESVHPSIYAVYDIMESLSVDDPQLCHQLKEHILTIEDCFVNSQEWTLCRAIPNIRLGIVGSTRSGKSALVHRYLTGTYLQDESPEGGRFKKEACLDGQSYLLMIRDEGGAPDIQFSLWVDAVIFVFSLEDETSLRTVLDYYRILMHERQNLVSSDLPMILVGTQDSISEYRPRVVDEARARAIANDMNRSVFYETCATYGLNVDKVFHEICRQVSRRLQPVSSTPLAVVNPTYHLGVNQSIGSYSVMASPAAPTTGGYMRSPSALGTGSPTPHQVMQMTPGSTPSATGGPVVTSRPSTPQQQQQQTSQMQQSMSGPYSSQLVLQSQLTQQPAPTTSRRSGKGNENVNNNNNSEVSTNVSSRPQRTNNNVFNSQKLSSGSHTSHGSEQDLSQRKHEDEGKRGTQLTDPIGSGRSIPLKMGYLEKRSHKTLNKEWKKKFVTLSADGILTYYDNMKDYQENCSGKTIDLGSTTVKIPGVGYSAGMKTGATAAAIPDCNTPPTTLQTAPDKPLPHIPDKNNKQTGPQHKKSKSHSRSSFIAGASVPLSISSLSTNAGGCPGLSGLDNEGCEFQIVSLSNRKWRFWVESVTERDAWISAIKEATENAIQNRVGSSSSTGSSSKKSSAVHRNSSISFQPQNPTLSQQNNPFRLSTGSSTPSTMTDMPSTSFTYPSDLPATLRPVSMSANELIQALRDVPGNQYCADCGAEGAMWASVNLGIVVCITCAGFHRDLGTHVSRVRSINLDTWPQLHVNVMLTIGNTMANSVWEAGLPLSQNAVKPGPSSSSAERGKFIREKYQDKIYLAPPPYAHAEGQQQLIDAIARGDTRQVILMLAINQQHEFVNTPYSKEDQRLAIHIAATLGYLVYLQLLAWAFADMSAPDGEGRNAYFYAVASNAHDCAEFLLHSGCSTASGPSSVSHQRVSQSTTPNTYSVSSSTSSIGSNRQLATQSSNSNSTNVSSSAFRQRPSSAVSTSNSSISTTVPSSSVPLNVSTGSGTRAQPN